MIVYQSDAYEFKQFVNDNLILDEIEKKFSSRLGRRVAPGERTAWNNSMQFMEKIVRNSNVPDDCGILIEYGIPATSKRIDFIISGQDENNNENFIIIELKQWSTAQATDKNGIVISYVGNNIRELTHPSYQAQSYKLFLADMNEAIYNQNIIPHSCSYLHNYCELTPEPLKQPQYREILNDTPIYFQKDNKKLQEFIYKHVGKGKGCEILYRIENGKIKPSKKLIDCVSSMYKGNKDFIMIDEQKIAYENIINVIKESKIRTTIIVKGGPGTGKSVISINAFGELLKNEKNIIFVAPNSSFRTVLTETLSKNNKNEKNRIKNLFSGSSRFYGTNEKTFDAIIVDEAHRLKGKGAFMYKGQNQIDDIIKASCINIFFVDDTQLIRPDDIGTSAEIIRVAKLYKSKIIEFELEAQFRCTGAEGFINWIDHTLQIRETANYDGWENEAFSFEIFDSPHQVFNKIKELGNKGFKARMLAGYAWRWTAQNEGNSNAEIFDVHIEEHDFKMPWNSRAISTTWAIDDNGLEQIGCIHTSQGLEFDYVGILIGNDLKYDPKKEEIYASYKDYYDQKGKNGLKNDPERLTKLVKNIYKVLLSRGMKGCYIYCCDKELEKYLKNRIEFAMSKH